MSFIVSTMTLRANGVKRARAKMEASRRMCNKEGMAALTLPSDVPEEARPEVWTREEPPHTNSRLVCAIPLANSFAIGVAWKDRKTKGPEHDLAVTSAVTADYLDHHPRGSAPTFLVAIADSSFRMDRATKAASRKLSEPERLQCQFLGS